MGRPSGRTPGANAEIRNGGTDFEARGRRRTRPHPAQSGGAARRNTMDFLERAAEALRQARKLPPGEARNELRQIAVALRWLAEHPPSQQRVKLIGQMIESRRPCKEQMRSGARGAD